MRSWRRLMNVFRGERLNRELDDEMAIHLEEAAERGRDDAEASDEAVNCLTFPMGCARFSLTASHPGRSPAALCC